MRPRRIVCGIALMGGLFSPVSGAGAQDTPLATASWSHPKATTLAFASLGLGVGGMGGASASDDLAGMAAFTVIRSQTLFQIRTAGTEEMGLITFSPPSESTSDVGLLVGRANVFSHGIASFAAGVAASHSVRRGNQKLLCSFLGCRYNSSDRRALGVPWELAANLHAANFGVGVGVFGNVNAANNFAGIAVTIHAGKMR